MTLLFADLHIHSRYSRATSPRMEPISIAHYARVKGLNIVGTGDFTHPEWLHILKEFLIEDPDHPGLFHLSEGFGEENIWFLLQAEICTVFPYQGVPRKVHHVILSPSFEVTDQVNDILARYGPLDVDGRPSLPLSAPELVELLSSLSGNIEIFPAHAWTPWYGLFGSKVGFNSLEECYQDTTPRIHALETGLSSDPLMNWRLSSLDRVTLISSSDSHSPYPSRMGREATVFDLEDPSYPSLIKAIRGKDPREVLYTIETYPQYGKYHWTGHRKCNISMSPSEAMRIGNICPICGRSLTIGVEQRVEELADRPPSSTPPGDFPGFKYLLPLEEILGKVLRKGYQVVQGVYRSLIEAGGSEYRVMLDLPLGRIAEIGGGGVALAIKALREGTVKVKPGYDGVYGEMYFPTLHEASTSQPPRKPFSLDEFM